MRAIDNISSIILWTMLLSCLLCACGSKRVLKENEKRFDGTSVNFMDKENISDRANLMREIDLSLLDKSTEFVFKKSMIRKTSTRIQNLMIGSGYFKSKTHCYSEEIDQKVKIKCDVILNPRHKIDSVFYFSDTLPIVDVLRPMYKIDFLKPGEYFQRKNVIKDRDAFVETANNNGYPFVSKDDVVFIIDTTQENHLVDVHLQLKPSRDSSKYSRHRYGKFYINPNYSLDKNISNDTTDMDRRELFNISFGYDFIKEETINDALYMREGTIYNRSKNSITSNRLLNLGLFKFVNVKAHVNEDKTVDHFFNLTPFKMESVTGEIDLNNRSGNFWGTTLKSSYINKNLFNGAERFDLSLTYGLETTFGETFINTNDIGIEASLSIPTVGLPPPFKFPAHRNFPPRTIMSLSFNHQRRVDFYSYASAKFQYGIKWNETQYKSSYWNVINLQALRLISTTAAFEQALLDDPRLKLSFDNTMIFGGSYEYIYNEKNKYNPLNQIYFKGTVESAGNIIYGLQKLLPGESSSEVFGIPYSQYVRFTADFRKYWGLPAGSIASRLVVGTAFALGNTTAIPYAKQYSVGGSNDLRAFALRTIGPGTFQSQNNQFLDQTGDIKVEANVEYRFPIYKYFKGAFFMDAGNVWLTESTDRPDGVFEFNNFLSELAVGTGFSLRFDYNIFVVRAFVAFPIRDLTDTGKFDWVLDKISFGNSQWRSDNLQYNLGIGYPF